MAEHILYPHLFQETTWPWGPTRARFILLEAAPPGNLVANINIVPRIGNKWVILRLADGTWEIPGGTLEPGEDYLQAIRRELREEAGAQLISYRLIGAWSCFSLADKPYRPYLPHPHYFRLVLSGEIKVVQTPDNPKGAEDVKSVEIGSIKTAISRFNSQGRYDLAELYHLASKLFQPKNPGKLSPAK